MSGKPDFTLIPNLIRHSSAERFSIALHTAPMQSTSLTSLDSSVSFFMQLLQRVNSFDRTFFFIFFVCFMCSCSLGGGGLLDFRTLRLNVRQSVLECCCLRRFARMQRKYFVYQVYDYKV
jgi:hypothetical protein